MRKTLKCASISGFYTFRKEVIFCQTYCNFSDKTGRLTNRLPNQTSSKSKSGNSPWEPKPRSEPHSKYHRLLLTMLLPECFLKTILPSEPGKSSSGFGKRPNPSGYWFCRILPAKCRRGQKTEANQHGKTKQRSFWVRNTAQRNANKII